ncbi:nucleoside monophosphate kinase [Acidobacteria bacterium AH-259-D05]|nr:nucleoside monophosphate kinase [Acidobacteria bacterium AH-259-D05]
MKDLSKLKEAMKEKKILLLGLKGSGKGNRSRDLMALGLVHVGLGMIMREQVRKDPNSELSFKIVETTRRGELLPDEIVLPIIMDRLDQCDCRKRGFILDGFPRTKAQADWLLSRVTLDLALYLDVPKTFLVDGIVRFNRRSCTVCGANYSDFDPPKVEGICDKCGNKLLRRKSDNLEVIQARLKSDEEQIKSFLPSFEARGLLETFPIIVDDDQEIDDQYLKKLRGEIYWVQTDRGDKARMLNYEGMRRRLYNFLERKFM